MAQEPTDDPLPKLLDSLARGDKSAIEELIEYSIARLHRLTHLMLAKKPKVRRWYQTDDVFQAAVLRLRKALGAVTPESPEHFIRLATLQIRRELCDLARHEFGPQGDARNHHSNGAEPDSSMENRRRKKRRWGPATQALWKDFLEHSLPKEEREIFDLLEIYNMSQEEAAKHLQISVATVRRRSRSARLLLHKALHPTN